MLACVTEGPFRSNTVVMIRMEKYFSQLVRTRSQPSGLVHLRNRAKALFWAPPVYRDLSARHDWPIRKAFVDLPIR